jgi:hypothetical protein
MNGEKVYVDTCGHMDPKSRVSFFDGNIQILKHRELVRALNSLFKDAEEYPNDVQFDLSNLIYLLNLSEARGTHHPKVETVKEDAVKFDDPRKVKIVKQSKLQQGKQIKYCEESKLIKGGLYKPSEFKAVNKNHILTSKGAAWLKAERAKPENHKNA